MQNESHWRWRSFNLIGLFLLVMSLAATVVGPVALTHAAALQSQTTSSASVVQSKSQAAVPTPFMHRPYYGSKTVAQRTTSFVDHDKPWYVNDGIFVRYDGMKWTNVSIGSCTGGVNCYDGHNGYDLNLWYEPVLSVAAGTVIRAGWYDPLNHQSALGLWAAVDHHNGYYTAYGHLSALTVSVGEQVGVQWQLGTSGTSGSSTGPHLHMATYYAPNWQATDPFGWTGNYPDPNVVPDYYLWVDNPGTTNTIPVLSSNGNATYPGATLVDDGGPGWSSTGNWNTATSSTDINGNLHWTPTTSSSATATANWQPQLRASGYYEVGVFVDDNHASSSWAPYTVYSADPNNPNNMVSHVVYVDETHIGSFQGPYGWENTGAQWISLGTYYFSASMAGRVAVSNATGENGPQLSADGMEFVPVSVQPTPTTNSYAFSVSNDSTPTALVPGSTTTVNLTLVNGSNFAWSASGANAVQVIYRWLNAQNQVVASGNGVGLPQDVAVNASVNVAVPVVAPAQAGTYTLQWDMQQGSTVFSHMGAQVKSDQVVVARYAEAFGPAALPSMLTPGATVQLNVGAQNRGALPWSSTGSAQVTLGYHWLDSAGNPVSSGLVAPAAQGLLPADVPPGGSVSVPITLNTPVLAGTYKLVYDFQQQGVTFSSQGATPLTMNVTITPNLPRSYYFAEGYTGTGTTEYLSLTNPSASAASISITYLFDNAAARTKTYTVPAQSHTVLDINTVVGSNQTVSMIVQGNQPFVAERSMYVQKGALAAASDSIGSSQLSSTWYFAEGNTTFGWNTLLSVLNPSTQTATIQVTYLLSARSRSGVVPRSQVFTVAARSRGTIVLNQAMPNQQFGMSISASTAVMIERPEYLVASAMRGGSSVVGATSPQTRWYFGAGNTASGVTESLVLANPNASWVTAQVHYLTTNGQVIAQSVGIAGQSRVAINVNAVVKQATHATVVTANGPIVAERQDFYNNVNSIMGSTTVMGASNTYTSWYIAQGDTNGGDIESLALANPGALSTLVQVVYYQSQSAPVIKSYTLAANTRMTINVASDVGANKSIGIAIYAAVPITVEHTLLYNANGVSGADGSMGYGV